MRSLFLLLFISHSLNAKNFFLKKSAHDTVYVADEVKNNVIISMRSAHIHSKNQLQSCFTTRSNLTQFSISKLNNLVGHWTHTDVPEYNHDRLELIKNILATGRIIQESKFASWSFGISFGGSFGNPALDEDVIKITDRKIFDSMTDRNPTTSLQPNDACRRREGFNQFQIHFKVLSQINCLIIQLEKVKIDGLIFFKALVEGKKFPFHEVNVENNSKFTFLRADIEISSDRQEYDVQINWRYDKNDPGKTVIISNKLVEYIKSCTLTDIVEIYPLKILKPDALKRSKRQIILGAIATGLIAGEGFFLYHDHKELKKAEHSVTESNLAAGHLTKDLAEKFNTIETQVEHSEQTIKAMLRSRCEAEDEIAIEVFDEIVIEQFMLFRQSVESIVSAISAKSPSSKGVEILSNICKARNPEYSRECIDYFRSGHHAFQAISVVYKDREFPVINIHVEYNSPSFTKFEQSLDIIHAPIPLKKNIANGDIEYWYIVNSLPVSISIWKQTIIDSTDCEKDEFSGTRFCRMSNLISAGSRCASELIRSQTMESCEKHAFSHRDACLYKPFPNFILVSHFDKFRVNKDINPSIPDTINIPEFEKSSNVSLVPRGSSKTELFCSNTRYVSSPATSSEISEFVDLEDINIDNAFRNIDLTELAHKVGSETFRRLNMSSLEQTAKEFERISLGLDPVVAGHARRIALITSLSLGTIFIIALIIVSIFIFKRKCCVPKREAQVTLNLNELESSRCDSLFNRDNLRSTLVPTRSHSPRFSRADHHRSTIIPSRTGSF
jgi:hypothetical protein